MEGIYRVWLRINEHSDVLASLSLCEMTVSNVSHDIGLWKWAILSLHNCLQGAMVCHLSGTARVGALTSKCAESWLEWHDKDRRGEIEWVKNGIDEFGVSQKRIKKKSDFPPKDHLASPSVLFDRLHDSSKRYEGGCGKILIVTPNEQKAFNQLNNLRNDFAHFTPKGWSIETTGLPDIFLNIAQVLQKISTDPWPFRNMSSFERERLEFSLVNLRKELKNLSS